jgi:hypothetical protein
MRWREVHAARRKPLDNLNRVYLSGPALNSMSYPADADPDRHAQGPGAPAAVSQIG